MLVPHAALKTFADTVPSKLFEVLACARPLVASVSGEAAAILGAVNFAIAAILFLIAAKPPGGRELELATEIHGSAVDALQLEARALQSQVSGAFHHPLHGILPLLIVPLITIIIKSLKKPAATPAATAAAEQK